MAKKTLEEVKNICLSKGLIMIDRIYKNTKTKINCVDFEGYKYALTLDSIKDKRTQRFSRFDAFNPYTIENIKHYISTNDISSTLLSKEYKSMNKDKLSFKCECENVYEVSLHHFINNNMYKCKKCSMSQEGKGKLFLEEVVNRVVESGYIPLFKEYTDKQTPLEIETKEGYKGMSTLNNIETMNNISTFDYRNPYVFYNMRKYIKDNNINCNIFEKDDYRGQRDKITFTCSQCGRKFKTTWSRFTLYEKHRCDVCTKAQSKISLKTEKWLKDNGFDYEKEVSFDDCVYERKLRFDYKVCTREGFVLIEVDGSYHYTNPYSKEALLKQKKKDEIKNKYCKQNNIELIRLPWWWFVKTELYKKELSNKLLG